MDSRYLNKEFLIEFFTLYREQECLWRIKSEDYSNREKKQEAYNVLINKYKEIDPTVTREVIVRKIDSYRGSFRKELKKVIESEKSGTSIEDRYRPRLWYFKHLLFLRDQECGRKSLSNTAEDNIEQIMLKCEPEESDWALESPSAFPTSNFTEPHSTSHIQKKKRWTETRLTSFPEENNSQPDAEDEFSVAGKKYAFDLKAMSVEQRTIAERIISDVIYYAKRNRLSDNSALNLNAT